MTKENKQLLLTDLCARLPYGVICRFSEPRLGEIIEPLKTGGLRNLIEEKWDVKPFLRPMPSMTEEEKKEFIDATDGELRYSEVFDVIKPLFASADFCASFDSYLKAVDWLNRNHFDYRGLISKGLAIEVTEENNPYVN